MESQNMNDRIEMIQLDLIEPHPANRTIGGFNQEKLDQLAESIKAVGVQQPAVVRIKPICNKETCTHLKGMDCESGCCRECKTEESDNCNSRCSNSGKVKYQLVAGERRWRASRIAGNDTIPSIVRDLDDITALKIQTIENLQRDDIHPLDEANGYSQLIDQAGCTIETVAADVGKSISYVYQRIKLSSLIDELKKLFVENKITAGHAILIARLGPEQQREIIKENALYKWRSRGEEVVSVRDLNEFIHNHIMLDLSHITWKFNDTELVPEAGACEECIKRTGYQKELFADVCKNGNKKKDYCMDKVCFAKKQERIVERKREELKDQEIIEVVDCYSTKTPENAIDYHKWTECKKKDPGAKKILIVAGNQPGRVTYGTINTSSRYSYQKSQEQKAKEKKERQKEKEAEQLRAAKAEAVIQAAEALPMGTLSLEAFRICITKIWKRLGFDLLVNICKYEGWIEKATEYSHSKTPEHLKTMDQKELNRILLRIAISDEVKVSTYCRPNTETIDALMKIYDVKVENTKAPTKKKKEKIK